MTLDLAMMTPEVQATKEQTNRTSSKLKTCASRDTVNIVKRQSTEWEKIFANHMSDEG